MKVLMFGWEYPPFNSGGLGVACQGLARALSAQGVDLIFVLPKRLGNFGESFRFLFADSSAPSALAVNSLLVPYLTSKKYSRLRSGQPGFYGDTLLEEVARYAELAASLAQKVSFDLIHAHDWLTFSAGMAAKKVSGKPFIAHVHATEVDRTAGHVNQAIYDRERAGLHAADRIISVSEFTRQILIHQYGLSPDKIAVVHNGLDPANYAPRTPPDQALQSLKRLGFKIVLFVGRLTIMKGPDHLVSAAQKVIAHEPKAVFVIVGSGDLEGPLMHQVAAAGLSDKFLFPGFLRGEALSAVYKAADLFVMPSVSEPFGLTPLESLLHRTPVIVSKQSGVSEVLNHALKVDFWDTEELADKILSVIHYPSLQKVLRQNGTREARLCTWDQAARKCLQIYSQQIS